MANHNPDDDSSSEDGDFLLGDSSSANDNDSDPESIFGGEAEPLLPEVEPEPRPEDAEALRQRRADIELKQERVAKILEELGCEGVVLLMPAHVAWFTGGMNVRGLLADSERPGIYTNGRQRWLLSSNIDMQRLFDEELDGLGFQVKEWQWNVGRAVLLGELVAGKKFATDRPFPQMPLINDKLRAELRPLTSFEEMQYRVLGADVAHAVEATARNARPGDTEAELAGHMAHRLVRRGVEVSSVSVVADARAAAFRRTGYTQEQIQRHVTLQATGAREGLYVTAGRSVSWGEPPAPFRTAFDLATKYSAVLRSQTKPGQTVPGAATVAKPLFAKPELEYEWR
ncbi:MAG: hypothetical protein ACRCZF_12705, partial [Gemmataceae bacterium]